MSSRRWDPSNVRLWLARRERGEGRTPREEGAALAARWAVGGCDHCGRTIVMGEPVAHVHRFDHDAVLCADCLAVVPDEPTWVAASPRPNRPVALVTPERDLERAA